MSILQGSGAEWVGPFSPWSTALMMGVAERVQEWDVVARVLPSMALLQAVVVAVVEFEPAKVASELGSLQCGMVCINMPFLLSGLVRILSSTPPENTLNPPKRQT